MYDIEDIPLFSALEEKFLKEIRDQVLVKQYSKESIVFYEGDKSEYLHILLEGTVKVFKTTPKGAQVQINRFTAPSLIAEFACFEREPFPATCEFITDGTIGLLHFDTLFEYLKIPEFSLELINSLTKKISLLSSLVHKETILSSDAKVADLMLNNPSTFIKLKNNEIAAILNVTPETFSRIMTKLKKENIIRIEGNKIEILNEDALYNIVENNTMKECTNCLAHFKAQLEQEKTKF
ncbi:MAG: Crp/Fnr family transcriptional regulator [Epsilonproteobacteria bacterium]|nr:Crp/Fnr family transcriptional regulator [Campylobacterota bacterium]